MTGVQTCALPISYIVNFAFGAVITVTSLDHGFWVPTALSVLTGVVPVIACWWIAGDRPSIEAVGKGVMPDTTDRKSVV